MLMVQPPACSLRLLTHPLYLAVKASCGGKYKTPVALRPCHSGSFSKHDQVLQHLFI